MKPLFVGELNPYGSDERYALYPEPENSAGGRLCRLVLGLSVKQYIRHFDRANLCVGKWSNKEARRRADAICAESSSASGRKIVLLGVRVSAAFGVSSHPFTVVRRGSIVFVVLPHPSGLNQVWNQVDAFDRARVVLRENGILPVDDSRSTLIEDLLSTGCTMERPARCENCGIRVDADHCPDCGPP